MARGDVTGRSRRPSGGYVSPMDQPRTTGRGSSGTAYTYSSRLAKQKEALGVDNLTARARMMGIDIGTPGRTRTGKGSPVSSVRIDANKLENDIAALNQVADEKELGARQMEEIKSRTQEEVQMRARAGRRNRTRRSLIDTQPQGLLGPSGTLGA